MSDAPSDPGRPKPGAGSPHDADDKTLVTDFEALAAEMAALERERDGARAPRRPTKSGLPTSRGRSAGAGAGAGAGNAGGWATSSSPAPGYAAGDAGTARPTRERRDPTLDYGGLPPGMAQRAQPTGAESAPLVEPDEMTMPLGSLTAQVREQLANAQSRTAALSDVDPELPNRVPRTLDIAGAVHAAREATDPRRRVPEIELPLRPPREINTLAGPRPPQRPTADLRAHGLGEREPPRDIDIQMRPQTPPPPAGRPRGATPRVRDSSAPRVKNPQLRPVAREEGARPPRKMTRHLKPRPKPHSPAAPVPEPRALAPVPVALQQPRTSDPTVLPSQDDATGPGARARRSASASASASTPRAPRPSAADTTLLGRMTVLVLIVLFEAVVLPGYHDGAVVGPWAELARPGSATFVGAAFFVLVLVVALVPIAPLWRAVAATFLGLGLTVFGAVLVGAAVSAGAFDGQPALAAIFGNGPATRLVLLLAAVTLFTGLYWRRADAASIGARVLVGTGFGLAIFVYMGLHAAGPLDSVPLAGLGGEILGGTFVGDRVAAALAFLPLLVAPFSLGAFLRAPSTGGVGVTAGLLWLTAVLPMLVLALFVAPAGRWELVLQPIQVCSIFAAGLLFLPLGIGHLLGIASAGEVAPSTAGR